MNKVIASCDNSCAEDKVTHMGKWRISDNITIDCYVTKNKRRVLSLRGAARAINLKGNGSGALLRNLKSKWLEPYLSDRLKEWVYRASRGKINKIIPFMGPAFIPFEASLFVDICNAYIKANGDGILTQYQSIIADRLLKIMIAFAKVGIEALIDEITGYQEIRKKTELEKLLSKYISEEFRQWTKIFPDEFYEQLFRLRGWESFKDSRHRIPKVVGKYTNDIVYERLPQGVLEELKSKSPQSKAGNHSVRFHQSLTEDVGLKHLEKHLVAVIALMKISQTWDYFLYYLDRAYKRKGQQIIRYV